MFNLLAKNNCQNSLERIYQVKVFITRVSISSSVEPGRAPRRGTLIYVAHPLLSDSAAALLFTHNCEILTETT